MVVENSKPNERNSAPQRRHKCHEGENQPGAIDTTTLQLSQEKPRDGCKNAEAIRSNTKQIEDKSRSMDTEGHEVTLAGNDGNRDQDGRNRHCADFAHHLDCVDVETYI